MHSPHETLLSIEKRAERAIVQELRLMVQEILILRPALGLQDRAHADALLLKLDRLEANQQVASAQDIAAPIMLLPDLQLPAAVEPKLNGYLVTLYGIDRDATDFTETAGSIEAALRLLAQRLPEQIGYRIEAKWVSGQIDMAMFTEAGVLVAHVQPKQLGEAFADHMGGDADRESDSTALAA
jgi:hypothetical protein